MTTDDLSPEPESAGGLKTEPRSGRQDNIVANLLKSPEAVARTVADDGPALKDTLLLLVAGVICHAVFGLAIGLFGGWSVGLMSAVKAPLIGLCSLALCMPSLYVFSAVGGAPLTVKQTFILGASCFAMTGLLLIALAPVAWLFSVSTQSVSFIVLLCSVLWLISAMFTLRHISNLKKHPSFQRIIGMKWWFSVLVLVTLQMVTFMQPLLTPADRGWFSFKKEFFVEHFVSCFDVEKD
ncbi:hypothetical protein JYT83_00680 [bacterium AH-315-F18]|nr:hypothetical protein [bacterium AH-315-F18]